MARNYIDWSNKRGSSNQVLEQRPHVTNLSNGTRYYSAVDAELYLGDQYVTEITSIQWSVQQQAMPIYGYNSYTFDDIAVGARLVQGQFSVNFIKAGFIQKIQEHDKFSRMSRKLYGKDNKAKSYFQEEYRKRLNTPLWDSGFDIVVGFGDHSGSVDSVTAADYKTYMVLDCCQITGSMIQLDYNGEPIQEVYTFIARDIKYSKATESEKDPSAGNGTDPNDTINRPGKYNYIATLDLTKTEGLLTIGTKEQSQLKKATVTLLESFKDATLKSPMHLSASNSNVLVYSISRDKTKSLLKECKEKSTLKAEATITYVGQTSTSSDKNGQATEITTLQIEVNKA